MTPIDNPRADWTIATLTELLSGISGVRSAAQAIRGTVDAVAEALDAEITVLLRSRDVVASLGFRSGEIEAELLLAATASRHSSIYAPGIGRCATLTVEVEGQPGLRLLTARYGDDAFTANEAALLDGMASALGLMLKLLDRIERERTARQHTEVLLSITNAIARRKPHEMILQLISEQTQTLLGEIVVMRMRSEDEIEGASNRVIRGEGLNTEQIAKFDAIKGLGSVAMSEEHIVETYGDDLVWVRDIIPNATGAIASPIFTDGIAKGSLGILSTSVGRTFTETDKNLLRALSELASIVFTDAEAMRSVVRARHDLLTGLPSRGLILETLADSLAKSAGSISLLFLDLDGFKPVNDRFGHEVGDATLRAISQRMKEIVGERGHVGRFGGDEFVVVLETDDIHDDEQVADRLIAGICQPIHVRVGPRTIEVSVGVSIGITNSRSTKVASELVQQSDAAMYQAKTTGGNRWRRYLSLSATQAG
jgi:diguanylate cyclase (GGDEF)-like protein